MKTPTLKIKKAFWPVFGIYFLIAFEFFYMATPFAIYFYSAYKPALELINKIPFIAHLSGFFLPHLVEETNSPLLNIIKPAGILIASLGLPVFIVCALQVYYSKIFKKGMVSGGLYTYIRHPQYLGFSICGFGLLLLWPRFLNLTMYITLLFAYYLLAKAEEKECEKKFGSSYIDYTIKTNMFLPFRFPIIDKIKNIFWIQKNITAVVAVTYILVMLTSFLIAKGIKNYSVHELFSIHDKNSVTISIFKKDCNDILEIISIAKSDPKVKKTLDGINQDEKLINYIYPADMYISEIPMQKPDGAECHVFENKFAPNMQAIIFTKAEINSVELPYGVDILTDASAVHPVIEVWIDTASKKIIKAISPSGIKRYDNIREPVF